MRLLLFLLLSVSALAGDRAIYDLRSIGSRAGGSEVTRLRWTGFLVRDIDTNQTTEIAGTITDGVKTFTVIPFTSYLYHVIMEPRSAASVAWSKAESPGTQFADDFSVSDLILGRISMVPISFNGPRPTPKTMRGTFRNVTNRGGPTVVEVRNTIYELRVRDSVASNLSGETFDNAVQRSRLYFLGRGYAEVVLPPANINALSVAVPASAAESAASTR